MLSDISLQLKRGSVMFLFGPNGCGKSTLLGCVTGFNRPESGSVLISGKPLREYNSRQLAALVSYIPQSHTKTFPYKVSEVVLMGRTFSYGMFSSPGQKDRSLAAEALEKAGLIGFENRPYTELSGGELRLVLIARALCQNSPLMLLDEPTSHLDFKHEINVMNTLAKLVKETGLTLLLASHSLNHPFFFESEGINTSVALMDKGRILQTGRPESVCTRENIYGVYGIEARLKVHHEDGKNRYYVISWKQE
ncbi:MAG: ABC transporter ATP-binding protein [Oscillospiraceae bacterium]|nr:ABC transporter ATP-binding protein [Oscillospiraceae bacterium]